MDQVPDNHFYSDKQPESTRSRAKFKTRPRAKLEACWETCNGSSDLQIWSTRTSIQQDDHKKTKHDKFSYLMQKMYFNVWKQVLISWEYSKIMSQPYL